MHVTDQHQRALLARFFFNIFRSACRDVGWPIRQCLIWQKNVLVMGRQDYQWKHEPCLYGWMRTTGGFGQCKRSVVPSVLHL